MPSKPTQARHVLMPVGHVSAYVRWQFVSGPPASICMLCAIPYVKLFCYFLIRTDLAIIDSQSLPLEGGVNTLFPFSLEGVNTLFPFPLEGVNTLFPFPQEGVNTLFPFPLEGVNTLFPLPSGGCEYSLPLPSGGREYSLPLPSGGREYSLPPSLLHEPHPAAANSRAINSGNGGISRLMRLLYKPRRFPLSAAISQSFLNPQPPARAPPAAASAAVLSAAAMAASVAHLPPPAPFWAQMAWREWCCVRLQNLLQHAALRGSAGRLCPG
ncbi:unnamed protein product [Closterium sp. NIES-64]|nr:unnamed protein product [Closterium sp. NIES-64]